MTKPLSGVQGQTCPKVPAFVRRFRYSPRNPQRLRRLWAIPGESWTRLTRSHGAGEPWPDALRFSRPDGSADWVATAFSTVYTVVTCWLVLQVRGGGGGNLQRISRT